MTRTSFLAVGRSDEEFAREIAPLCRVGIRDLENPVRAQTANPIRGGQPLRKEKIPRRFDSLGVPLHPTSERRRREKITCEIDRGEESHFGPALQARGYGQEHVGKRREHAPVADIAGIAVTQPHAKPERRPFVGPTQKEWPVGLQKAHANAEGLKAGWDFLCHGHCTH